VVTNRGSIEGFSGVHGLFVRKIKAKQRNAEVRAVVV